MSERDPGNGPTERIEAADFQPMAAAAAAPSRAAGVPQPDWKKPRNNDRTRIFTDAVDRMEISRWLTRSKEVEL